MSEKGPIPSDASPAPPILVVEDDREQREALCAMLDLEGFRHAEAANGKEALDYLGRSSAPCLVLLDLEMPVMSGWDFRARQLADERLSHVPVVVVTGNAKDLSKRFPGVKGFLWKPMNFEKLVAILDGVCRRETTGLPVTTPATA